MDGNYFDNGSFLGHFDPDRHISKKNNIIFSLGTCLFLACGTIIFLVIRNNELKEENAFLKANMKNANE